MSAGSYLVVDRPKAVFSSFAHSKQKEEVSCQQLSCIHRLRHHNSDKTFMMDVYQEALDYLESQHVPGEETLFLSLSLSLTYLCWRLLAGYYVCTVCVSCS